MNNMQSAADRLISGSGNHIYSLYSQDGTERLDLLEEQQGVKKMSTAGV